MPNRDLRYLSSCDTLVAFTGPHDRRRAIFAKNSDRPGLECQPLTHVEAATHRPSSTVQCQYVSIPQVPRTLAVLGSRPHWLWGFEQGVNEKGVAIGNEAIYTHDPVPDVGLLGMDLVRLGLERGSTASEAKNVITDLLEEYGQGGSSVLGSDVRYHNSFIIADVREAWVIESSRRHWVARQTAKGAVIGNLVTIEDDWDECSDGVEDHAREMGYWSAPTSSRFDFRAAYEDPASRVWTEDRYRVGCRLLADTKQHDISQMLRYLRDHFEGGLINVRNPKGEELRRSVCYHSGSGSTSASMVVELAEDALPPLVWTSMATPCTSIFVPIVVGEALPRDLEVGGAKPETGSAWWAMRELQYIVDRNPALLAAETQATWTAIEADLLERRPRLTTDELRELIGQIRELRDGLIFRLTALEMTSDPGRVPGPGAFID